MNDVPLPRLLIVPTQEKGRGGGHLMRCIQVVEDLRKRGLEAYLYDAPPEVSSLAPQDPFSTTWSAIILDRFQTKKAELSFWRQWGPVVGLDEGGPCRASFDYLIDIIPSLPPRIPPNLFFPQALGAPSVRRPAWPEKAPHSLRMLVSFGAEDPLALSVPAARLLLASRWGSVTIVVGPRNRQGMERIQREFPEGSVAILRAPNNLKELLTEYDLVFTHYGLTAYEALFARVPVILLNPTPYHHRLARWYGFYSLGVGKGALRRLNSLVQASGKWRFFSLVSQSEKGRPSVSTPFPHSSPTTETPVRDAMYHKACTASRGVLERCKAAEGEGQAVSCGGALSESERPDPRSLADLLCHWAFPGEGRCPLCGGRPSAGTRALARFPDRTYFCCAFCGMTYMVRPQDPAMHYDGAYFGEEYKKQYGRTYVEDFPHLKNMGRARLRQIGPLLAVSPRDGEPWKEPREEATMERTKGDGGSPSQRKSGSVFPSEQRSKGPTLLDIGCAYGPFLDAAREEGFTCFGMDPSSDGIGYVQHTLGIPAARAFFPQEDPRRLFGCSSFDVITLWYVIEHFPNLKEVLSQINACLPIGGVFAFSTPSLSGISGRTNLSRFLERSPADHWTLWDPRKIGDFLARFGFKLVKIQSTGHHPERFPWIGPVAEQSLPGAKNDKSGRASWVYRFLLKTSRVLRLGDTFEAYAIKIRHLDSR
ncbi:MAG TPA: methyltransferase domain-containing protein [Termitinemataceae bacterium]|nr:methyltransferase domain-containing protein [Termitinemataceae bacterium]HOM23857.1 methyltransferase domain-containing protein [Termitinemataceae bacterium]HPP99879.1 methyltransferase domain-containing protein [Termitinemataceae bacterium]